jgi:hypothetical protein
LVVALVVDPLKRITAPEVSSYRKFQRTYRFVMQYAVDALVIPDMLLVDPLKRITIPEVSCLV